MTLEKNKYIKPHPEKTKSLKKKRYIDYFQILYFFAEKDIIKMTSSRLGEDFSNINKLIKFLYPE